MFIHWKNGKKIKMSKNGPWIVLTPYFQSWGSFFLVIDTEQTKIVLKPALAGASFWGGKKLKSSCFHVFMFMFTNMNMKTWPWKHENINFLIFYPLRMKLLPMLVSELSLFILYLLPKKSTSTLKLWRQNNSRTICWNFKFFHFFNE